MASIDVLFIICDLLTDHIDRLSIQTFALCIIMTLTFLNWLSCIELVFFTYFSIVVVFLSLQNQKSKEKNMPIWLAIQMILSINTRLIVSYACCVVKFHLLWLYWFLVCIVTWNFLNSYSFHSNNGRQKKNKQYTKYFNSKSIKLCIMGCNNMKCVFLLFTCNTTAVVIVGAYLQNVATKLTHNQTIRSLYR